MKSSRIVAICLFFLWTVASLSAVIAQSDEGEPEPLSLTETETFNMAIGAVTVSYPEGWELIPRAWGFIDDSLQVIEFSNVPGFDVRTAHDESVSLEDVIFGSIYVFTHENQTLDEIALLLEDQNIVDQESFAVGDREGLTLWLEPSEGIAGESTTMILDDEYIVEIYADALPEVRDEYRSTLREMIASIEFVPMNNVVFNGMTLPERISDDRFRINYPEGAIAEAGLYGTFQVGSSQEVIDLSNSDEVPEAVESGTYLIYVTVLPPEQVLVDGTLPMNGITRFFNDDFDFDDPMRITVDGFDVLTQTAVVDLSGNGNQAGIYFSLLNNTSQGFVVLTLATTAPDEQDSIADLANAIAASYRFDED